METRPSGAGSVEREGARASESRLDPAVMTLLAAAAASSGPHQAASPHSSTAIAPSSQAAAAAGTTGGAGAGDREAATSTGISYSRWDNLEVSSDDEPAGATRLEGMGAPGFRILNGARVRIQNLGRHVDYNGQVSSMHTYSTIPDQDRGGRHNVDEFCGMRSLTTYLSLINLTVACALLAGWHCRGRSWKRHLLRST